MIPYDVWRTPMFVDYERISRRCNVLTYVVAAQGLVLFFMAKGRAPWYLFLPTCGLFVTVLGYRVLAAVRARRTLSRRRRRGACVHCGFDMTRSETVQCPECGRAWNVAVFRPRSPLEFLPRH